MDVLIERCAGLDVHRDTVVATVRRPDSGAVRRWQTRTLSTMTGAREELADWLASEKVTLAGMESTGVYWKWVYYVLEQRLSVWVINAEQLRNVPGRKTECRGLDVDRAAHRARVGVTEFRATAPYSAVTGFDPTWAPVDRRTHAHHPTVGKSTPGRGDQVDLGGLHDPGQDRPRGPGRIAGWTRRSGDVG